MTTEVQEHQKLFNHVQHTIGFLLGLSARIESWRIAGDALPLRAYAEAAEGCRSQAEGLQRALDEALASGKEWA